MLLTARDLVVARGHEAIAGPLSFTLSPGKALVVTGENGAGKSSLLRTLAGLLAPGSGRITVTGVPAEGGEDGAMRGLGRVCHYLGHRNAMKPGLSVAGNLSFWQAYLALDPPASPTLSVEAALDRVGLIGAARLPFAYLSAGQQRRAAIARLLVVRRPFWVLDEPTAALDAGSQALFSTLLGDHLAGGGALVAATHQPLGIAAETLHLEPRAAASDRPGFEAAWDAAEGWL